MGDLTFLHDQGGPADRPARAAPGPDDRGAQRRRWRHLHAARARRARAGGRLRAGLRHPDRHVARGAVPGPRRPARAGVHGGRAQRGGRLAAGRAHRRRGADTAGGAPATCRPTFATPLSRPSPERRGAAQNITAPTGSRSSLRAREAAHSEPGVRSCTDPSRACDGQGAGAEVRRGQRLHRQPQVGGVVGRDAPADAVVAGGEPPAPVVPGARVVGDVEHHVAGRGVAALRERGADVDQPQPQPVVRRRPHRAGSAGPPDHRVVRHASADPGAWW